MDDIYVQLSLSTKPRHFLISCFPYTFIPMERYACSSFTDTTDTLICIHIGLKFILFFLFFSGEGKRLLFLFRALYMRLVCHLHKSNFLLSHSTMTPFEVQCSFVDLPASLGSLLGICHRLGRLILLKNRFKIHPSGTGIRDPSDNDRGSAAF